MELAAQYLRLIGVGGWLHKGKRRLSHDCVLMYGREGEVPNYYFGEREIVEKLVEDWGLLGELVLPRYERNKMVFDIHHCDFTMILQPEGLLLRKQYPPEPTES